MYSPGSPVSFLWPPLPTSGAAALTRPPRWHARRGNFETMVFNFGFIRMMLRLWMLASHAAPHVARTSPHAHPWGASPQLFWANTCRSINMKAQGKSSFGSQDLLPNRWVSFFEMWAFDEFKFTHSPCVRRWLELLTHLMRIVCRGVPPYYGSFVGTPSHGPNRGTT